METKSKVPGGLPTHFARTAAPALCIGRVRKPLRLQLQLQHALLQQAASTLTHSPGACQPEITNLEVAGCVEEQVGGLEVAVQH